MNVTVWLQHWQRRGGDIPGGETGQTVLKEGDIREYPIPQEKLVNTEIPFLPIMIAPLPSLLNFSFFEKT